MPLVSIWIYKISHHEKIILASAWVTPPLFLFRKDQLSLSGRSDISQELFVLQKQPLSDQASFFTLLLCVFNAGRNAAFN